MSKVLSTKLTVDEIERFNTAAKQQGISKAGLLKRLAQEYLDDSNKVDRFSGVSEPNQNSSSKKGQLPEQYDSRNLPLEKPETPQNEELGESLTLEDLHSKTLHVVQGVYQNRPPVCTSNEVVNSLGKASLVRAATFNESTPKRRPAGRSILDEKSRTQAKPKLGFGELIFRGLIAVGVLSAIMDTRNQKALPFPRPPEINPDNYAAYNEDIAAVYRDMGLPYP